jgi:hypothetical protein
MENLMPINFSEIGSVASVPKSTVTTAGDLIVADGASSVTRLGVGTDDQVLTLASGAPAWADAGGGALDWTLLSSADFPTGANTSTVSGLSGYDNYLIWCSGMVSSYGTCEWRLNGISSGYLEAVIEVFGSTLPRTYFDKNKSGLKGPYSTTLDWVMRISGAASGNNCLIEMQWVYPNNKAGFSTGMVDLAGTPMDSFSIVNDSNPWTGFYDCRIFGA